MGPFPGNWLATGIADLTPDLQVLLSWGSTVVSFHSRQSLSVSFFHVSLGLPAFRLPSICISHAVLIAPLERSTCTNQRSLPSLKWGWGPQALPVIRLTLLWPCPLAWYCRSVWSWPYHCDLGRYNCMPYWNDCGHLIQQACIDGVMFIQEFRYLWYISLCFKLKIVANIEKHLDQIME